MNDPITLLHSQRKFLLKKGRLILGELQALYAAYTPEYKQLDEMIRELEDMLGIRQ